MSKKQKITEPGIYSVEVYTEQECEEFTRHTKLPCQQFYQIKVTQTDDGRWKARWLSDTVDVIGTRKPHRTAASAVGTVKRLIILAGV